MMAEYRAPAKPTTRTRKTTVVPEVVKQTVPILPPVGQLHNTLSRVVAIAHASNPAAISSGHEIDDATPDLSMLNGSETVDAVTREAQVRH
jgi:RNA polymerase sigma-32 factor